MTTATTTNLAPSAAALTSNLQGYLDRGVAVLQKYGIVPQKDEGAQMASLLEEAVTVDEPKVLAIGSTMKYMGTFNQLVRDNIEQMHVADRYADITRMFDTIREDSKRLVEQLADGKIDWKEGMANWMMKLRRGTPHQRFEKIREKYNAVTKDTKEHLDRETEILRAYSEFRFALKEAEVLAYEVMQKQESVLEQARTAVETATNAVTQYKEGNTAQQSRLQLERDKVVLVFQDEDRRYQLLKDLAENLTIGYQVGETLMLKLKQTHDVKEQVHRKAVTFFTTNEHVFTAMDAVYTSQQGLHEVTQTVEALKTGANKGLEDLAMLTGTLEKTAIAAGYGKTIDSSAVQKLVDAIVSFETEQATLIQQHRKEATKNAEEVTHIVEEGKQRYLAAMARFQQKQKELAPTGV